MKRKIYLTAALALALLTLAACSNSQDNQNSSSPTSENVTKKKSTATDVKSVSGTKKMSITSDDTKAIETIEYDGDDYKRIAVEMKIPLPDDVKKEAEGLDFNTVKSAILPDLEELYEIDEINKIDGATASVDLGQDMIVTIKWDFDMSKVDITEVAAYTTPVSWTVVQTETPLEYVLGLAADGAEEVK